MGFLPSTDRASLHKSDLLSFRQNCSCSDLSAYHAGGGKQPNRKHLDGYELEDAEVIRDEKQQAFH